MSRIGKMPINIPDGVKVEVVDDKIVVTGKHTTKTSQLKKKTIKFWFLEIVMKKKIEQCTAYTERLSTI